MAKSYKRRNNIIKNITQSANKSLPVVNDSLETVGNAAKGIAIKSVPIIEKGVSSVYGTMSTGLDLGVKEAKIVAKGISKTKKRRIRRSRSRKGLKSRIRR